jgi:hypothetical protein
MDAAAIETPYELAQDTELARIVRVNEEIKAIVTTAFKINLMALNAIFLAKRAGEAARGFGVLSNELRRFAQDLTREMTTLREMTANTVSTVTGVVQHKRLNSILDRAIELSPESGNGKALVQRRRGKELHERQSMLRDLDRRLRRSLEDTAQLVELGGVLARSAKIEAAYGGNFSASLMQVSSDFGDVITLIKQSLDRLGRLRLS